MGSCFFPCHVNAPLNIICPDRSPFWRMLRLTDPPPPSLVAERAVGLWLSMRFPVSVLFISDFSDYFVEAQHDSAIVSVSLAADGSHAVAGVRTHAFALFRGRDTLSEDCGIVGTSCPHYPHCQLRLCHIFHGNQTGV